MEPPSTSAPRPIEPGLIADLRSAVRGLVYPSESDTPFDVVAFKSEPGDSTAGDALARQIAGDKIARIQLQPADQFFGPIEQTSEAGRFRALRRLLEDRLAALGVFRIDRGEAEVDVYLLGRSRDGYWAGLHTVSVET